jgi:hypothetical protein
MCHFILLGSEIEKAMMGSATMNVYRILMGKALRKCPHGSTGWS